MKINCLSFLIFLLAIANHSCNQVCKSSYYHANMESVNMLNPYTRIESTEAIEGKYFSRMSNSTPFGGGVTIDISDSCLLKHTKVVFESKIRSNFLQTKGSIIVSLGKDDYPVSWNGFMATGFILNPNEWITFKDSIEFPKRVNGKVYNKISVFGFMNNPNELFDLDDLTVKVTYL